MTLRVSMLVLRRWRAVILAGVLIGIVVGWLSGMGTRTTTTTYQAAHTLLVDSTADGDPQAYRTMALPTLGPIPTRVAARLGIDRRVVQSHVYTETSAGLLVVVGRSTDRAQAEALANVTAEELIVELGGPKAPLHTLEPAVASPIETGDFQGPTSAAGRAVLLGAFGLFLGGGAAFALERFDNRIRSRDDAEEALGVPVVAEVPSIPRSNHGRLITGAEPSPFVEAYRGLRTSIDGWTSHIDNQHGRAVIAVTSPSPGEGKTTTVAHLAMTLGEIGRSVLVISADLRRPSLHLYFNKAIEPGLTDVLRGAPDTRRLGDLNLATSTRGVRFVASGAPVRNPASLLDHIADHLSDARSLGEFVLVDVPPLLTTSDGAQLAHHADAVLLVVRAGRTSIGAATRSVELLQRLDIPVIGAVLVAGTGFQVRS